VLCQAILRGNVPLKWSYKILHWIIAPWHVLWITMTAVGKYLRYYIIRKITHCTRAFQVQWQFFALSNGRFFAVRNRTMIFLLKLSGFVGFPLQVPHVWNFPLVGGLEHEFYFSIQLGISQPQLTNSMVFQRGRAQPPVYFHVDFAFENLSFWGNGMDIRHPPGGWR